MAHTEQRTDAAPEVPFALEAKNHQLQTLVGELLATNQELRFKVAQLELRLESAEHSLTHACAMGAALLP